MSGPAAALRVYADALARRDWLTVRATLSDELLVTMLHTGETFDADGFVAFNRDYPDGCHVTVDEIVDGGDRAVLRTSAVLGWETWYGATFASADDAGLLLDIVEVWSTSVTDDPPE